MVRPVESQKPRRSNMIHSSINSTPKKGGSGGSFTWGLAQDVFDYDHIGFDADAVGVTTLAAPLVAAIATDSLGPCDFDLADEDAFPALAVASKKESMSKHVVSPEDEPAADWVVVSETEVTNEARALRMMSMEPFDGQHPRNIFSKKANAKQAMAKSEPQCPSNEIDWSQGGIPKEVKKRILHGSKNSAHLSLHGQKPADPVPLSILRAQSNGSSKRSNSLPKTPRSHSKPRMVQQMANRR